MRIADVLTPELRRSLIQSSVREYGEKGYTNAAIAKILKRHMGVEISPRELREFRTVADAVRFRAPGIRANKKEGKASWRDWLPVLKKMQELKKRGSWSQDEAFIEVGDGTRPVAIASFSDQHWGAWSTDYDLFEKCTDELKEIPDFYAILTGDLGHYAIKLRGVLEVADNLLPPEQQTDSLEDWLDDVKDKVIAALWDNHGIQRGENQAGESSLKRLLSRRVTYFNGIGHIDIKVGDQIYHGAISHKFRGSSFLNPCHAQMRYMRFVGTDREFAMQGDTHEYGVAKYADGGKVRVAINSGSLQLNSGYGKRFFSLKTMPVFPLIVFWPDRHEMTPLTNVAEWLKFRKTI